MLTKNFELGSGTIIIGDQKWTGSITDFTYDADTAKDHIRDYIRANMVWNRTLTAIVNIDWITLLKLVGLWQMALDNCPNGRVRYLMQHGSSRTKLKNYRRACKLIGKMVVKEK